MPASSGNRQNRCLWVGGTGWLNRDISMLMVSAQKPSVSVKRDFVFKGKDVPQQFEFWIYTSSPSESFRIQPQGDLWKWQSTWPVTQITLEHKEPPTLTDADAVTLELPVQPDGNIPLPKPMPTGSWKP